MSTGDMIKEMYERLEENSDIKRLDTAVKNVVITGYKMPGVIRIDIKHK